MGFRPGEYTNSHIEDQGILCTNTFSTHGEKEILLDIGLTSQDMESLEETIDLQVSFTITPDMMAIEPIEYCYPAREFVLSRDNCNYNCNYGYRFPLSFLSASYEHMGLTLIFDDQEQNSVGVIKDNNSFQFIIQYNNIHIGQVQPRIRIIFHSQDWHQGFQSYKEWYQAKYNEVQKLDKRLIDCFHIRRYFFNTQFCRNGIYDGKDYYLEDQYKDDQVQAGGVDVALLFDYAYTPEDNIRCGNAEPFTNLKKLESLNQQIRACKEDGPFMVYAYFDPYLVQNTSDFDQLYGNSLPILNQQGETHHIWDTHQWHPCLQTDQWKNESIRYLGKVSEELEVDGLYIDEIGNGEQFICYNPEHNHRVPLNQNKAENEYIGLLKEHFPQKLFMGEFFPADSNISLFQSLLSDSKTIIDICRFAFPYKKIFKIIHCDRPIGDNSWDINKIFFNGMGLWLDNDLHSEEWYSPNVKRLIKKHYHILKKYSPIFESNDIEPHININSDAILGNRFTKGDKTIFTFINITGNKAKCDFPLRGNDNMAYDVYNNKPCEISTQNNISHITIELEAYEVTCIYLE